MQEQKKAVVSYASEHDLPATQTKLQWGLLEKMVALLAPFEEITKHISSAESSLADVIPVVAALQVALKLNANDSGVQTMKSMIVSDMRTRFSEMYDGKHHQPSLPCEAVHVRSTASRQRPAERGDTARTKQRWSRCIAIHSSGEAMLLRRWRCPRHPGRTSQQWRINFFGSWQQQHRGPSPVISGAADHLETWVTVVMVARKCQTLSECCNGCPSLLERTFDVSAEWAALQLGRLSLHRPPQSSVARAGRDAAFREAQPEHLDCCCVTMLNWHWHCAFHWLWTVMNLWVTFSFYASASLLCIWRFHFAL